MKKIKKLFAAGLLVIVSCFSFLGSAITNIARSFFSFGTAQADVGQNVGTDATKKGYIVYIPGFETSYAKGSNVTIPFTNGYGSASTAKRVRVKQTADAADYQDVERANIFVEVTNPFGQVLTKYDATQGTVVNADVPNVATQITLPANDANGDITLTPQETGVYKVKYYVLTNDVWTETSYYDIRQRVMK